MHRSLPRRVRMTSTRIVAWAAFLLMLLLARAAAQSRDYFGAMPPSTTTSGDSDPLPIRRMQVPSERVIVELERARQGSLIHLTREDFEARVKRARDAGDNLKKAPRLLEARYRAAQDGSSLTGTAQWTIVNPAAGGAVLAVQPLTAALRNARLDGKDAVLGDLDGKALGLLIPEPGKHVLTFDWSARGEGGPSGVRFRMELPPCTLTSVELELPANRELVALLDRVTCLLTGPKPATLSERKLWRLECPEPGPIELLVRPVSGAGQPAPVVLASLRSRQDLRPNPRTGQFAADFDVNLDILHGNIREVLCECDPALRPVSIRMRNLDLETWELQPGKTPGAPSILKIRFLEPLQGRAPLLRINCQAAAAPDQPWHAPGIHVLGAIPRGESLTLQVPAEFELHDFRSGNFDLRRVSATAEGGQTLSLRSGLRDPGASQRPSAVIKLQEANARVRALTWWQIRKETTLLTVQFSYEVSRGQVFQFPVTFPAGWQVDRVEMNPAALLRGWSAAASGKTAGVLHVELESSLRPGSSARLTVELHSTQDRKDSAAESILTFPVVAPENVQQWEGALGISIDPSLHATLNTPAAATTPPSLREYRAVDAAISALDPSGIAGPPLSLSAWTSQPPNFYYTHRAQPVTGTLVVRPRRARFHARCETDVTIGPGRASLHTRLLLEPNVGSVETVDVAVSAPVGTNWRWRSEGLGNAVRAFRRLPLVEETPHLLALGASSPVAAATLLSLPSAHTSVWRLTLSQPLHEPLTLETTIDFQHEPPFASGSRSRWEIPLLTVLSADRMTGEVRLHLAGTDRIEAIAAGLQETRAVATAGRVPAWRSFHYGHGPVSLSVSGQPASTERTNREHAGFAELATYADASGRLLNRYRFEIQNWRQRTLPVQLPAGARLLAARIDGRLPAQLETVADGDGRALIELPVVDGVSSHQFEVIYEIQEPPWRLWTTVESPAPALPLPVEAFRRTWWLAPGLAPLDESRLQRLPGHGSPGYGSVTKIDDLARLLANPAHVTLATEPWRIRQQRLAGEANAQRKKAAAVLPPVSLRGHLEELLETFKLQDALVVDMQAIQWEDSVRSTETSRAGPTDKQDFLIQGGAGLLQLDSLDGSPLVCLAIPRGPLLTTKRQWQLWTEAIDASRRVPDSIARAIAEAAQHGQDPSGRFRRAWDWLRQQTGEQPTLAPLTRIELQDFWTAWQPLAGDESEQTLLVMRPAALSGASWAFLVAFLVSAWRLRKQKGGARFGLLLLWLASGGLALLWLPASMQPFMWQPFLVGLAAACCWYLWLAIRATNRFVPKARTATGSVLLALGLALCLPGQAAAPSSSTVLLLPGGGDVSSQGTVLAPPDLLEQLRSMALRGVQGLRGAAFVSADYEGSVNQGRAVLKAVFKIYSFSEQSAALSIALAGVEMQDALLDSAPAYLVSQAAPLPAYSVQVKGRGMHKLELRFAVPVIESTANRELRCTIPEIEQSRLVLGVPAGATYVQSVSGRGAQRITNGAERVLLEADLGRVNTLQLRWRREGTPPVESVQVDEIHLWDLRSSGNTLHSVLRYTVLQGAPTILKIALPADVEISQIRTTTTTLPAPRLKNWHVTAAGRRQLELEFQAPVTSNVQVYLDLVSRLALAPSVALALPVPLNGAPGTANCFLGCRVEGRKANPVEFNRVTGIQPEEFNVLWQALDVEERGAGVDRAYSFRRTPAGGPVLRLQLQSPEPHLNCAQNLAWQISANHATVHATAKLDTPNDDISLIEWCVPAQVVVTFVDGPDIRSWSRTSELIQVWLRKSVKETSITMTGWLTKPDKPDNLLRLPCLYIAGAAPQWTTLRVLAANDIAVEPRQLQNVRQVPALRPSSRDRSYLSQATNYTAVFQVKPALGRQDARALTTAEIHERAFTFATTIDFNIREGELRTLTVRLRNWTGMQPRLEAPGVNARREIQAGASNHVWFLELQPGVTGHYALKLTGAMPLDAATEMLMPEVSVDEALGAEHLLATAGADLLAEETRGLQALADTTQALHWWPTERDHLKTVGGSVWKVSAEDWKLRLHPRAPRAQARPVRIVHEEYAAAVRDGRRWEYRGTYWLYQEAGTDVQIVMPAASRLHRMTLDSAEVTPAASGGNLWLPLAGSTGIRVLNLSWCIDGEALERPAFGQPHLQDASGALLALAKRNEPGLTQPGGGGKSTAAVGKQNGWFWIVHVPAGYRAVRQDSVPQSAAAYELNRAAGLVDLTSDLAEHAGNTTDASAKQELAAVQELVYRSCRFVQHQVNLAGTGGELHAESALAAALLQSNRQLAELHHFEPARAEAENRADLHPFTRDIAGISSNLLNTADAGEFGAATGIPSYWQIDAGLPGAALQFVPERIEQLHRAFALSSVIVLLSLIAWLVTYSPRLVNALQLLWPEQLAFLGYIAWQNFGFHPAFALVIVLGLAGRIYWLTRVTSILVKSWASRSSPSSSR